MVALGKVELYGETMSEMPPSPNQTTLKSSAWHMVTVLPELLSS